MVILRLALPLINAECELALVILQLEELLRQLITFSLPRRILYLLLERLQLRLHDFHSLFHVSNLLVYVFDGFQVLLVVLGDRGDQRDGAANENRDTGANRTV